MNKLYRTIFFTLGAVFLHFLVSYATDSATVTSSAIPLATTQDTFFAAKTAEHKTLNAQNTGNLLSPKQKAQLSQLGIPIALPSYVPRGFRLTYFSAEKAQSQDPGDYSSYVIFYQGANNTCLEFSANSDPAISLERLQKKSVATQLGQVKVYSGKVEGKPMIVGLFSLANNNGYMLRTGAWMPPNTPGGRCNPVTIEEYIQVLKSVKKLQ